MNRWTDDGQTYSAVGFVAGTGLAPPASRAIERARRVFGVGFEVTLGTVTERATPAEHVIETTSDLHRYVVRFGYGYIGRIAHDGKVTPRNAGCNLHPRDLARAAESAVDLDVLPPAEREAWRAAHRTEQARRDPQPR